MPPGIPSGADHAQSPARPGPSIQTSLARLGRALSIRGAEPSGLRSDSVQISPAAASASIPGSDGLSGIRSLLAELESLAAVAARDDAGAAARDEAQRRIDEAVAQIAAVAQRGGGARGIIGAGDPRPSNVTNIADGVEDIRLLNNDLAYRQRFDVEIAIEEPAERAGYFLSFGSLSIDLGTQSSFVFEISGNVGTRELSFASGTTIADIAAAINSLDDTTGVRATHSGTGIRLDSAGFGESQFVSVKVIDDGSIVEGGFFNVASSGDGSARVASSSAFTSFNSFAAANGITDTGKNLVVDSPSLFIETDGATVTGRSFADLAVFEFRIQSDTFGATLPGHSPPGGLARVFTISGDASADAEGPLDRVPLGAAAPIATALAPFASDGDSAGDFDAALDAIRQLQARFEPNVTGESLERVRRDLIADATGAIRVTALSDAQRALDLLNGSRPEQ